MTRALQEQLEFTGLAQVIVVLKSTATNRRRGLLPLNQSALRHRAADDQGLVESLGNVCNPISTNPIARDESLAALREICQTNPIGMRLRSAGVEAALSALNPQPRGRKPPPDEAASIPADLKPIENLFLKPPAGRSRDFELLAAASETNNPDVPEMFGGRIDPATLQPARYFEGLEVLLGTVDESGYNALLALARTETYKDRIEAIAGAPEFGFLRAFRGVGVVRPRTRNSAQEVLGVLQTAPRPTGQNARVGLVGGRVDREHPALSDAIDSASSWTLDALGRPIKDAKPGRPNRMTTHAAGTIAGRTIAWKNIGMAPGATLACLALPGWGNTPAQLLAALDWAILQEVDVLDLPVGVRGDREGIRLLLGRLRNHEILPVVPIGDGGPGSSWSPGNDPQALSVGAAVDGAEVAIFSSSQRVRPGNGPAREILVPRLVAPGVDVLSCVPGKGYAAMSGTVTAAAHIAGLAALLFGAEPLASLVDVESAIVDSCRPLKRGLEWRAAAGIPDATVALKRLADLVKP